MALKPFRISYHTCSSFPVGAPTEAKAKDLDRVWPSYSPIEAKAKDLWHRIGSGLLNVFVCLVSCHICYLFVLHDILFRLNGTGRRERRSFIAGEYLELACDSEESPKDRALVAMSGLWVYAFAIPQIFIAVLSSLHTGLDGDRACALALVILLAMFLVVERQMQGLRKDSATGQDEEAQDHRRGKPDLRTLPIIGRDTSFAYVQKLTHRLRKNLHEQDHEESTL